MPRGRIADRDRPVVDWSSLPEAVEIAPAPVSSRRTVEDIPPRIRELLDLAYDARKVLAQPVPDEGTGQEIARLLRAYGKLCGRTVSAVVMVRDGAWSVRVIARNKVVRHAAGDAPTVSPEDAIPGTSTGGRTAVRGKVAK